MTDRTDTTEADLIRATQYVETMVQPYLHAPAPPLDLALALMACGSALLVPIWGAERTLGAFDALVLAAAGEPIQGARH